MTNNQKARKSNVKSGRGNREEPSSDPDSAGQIVNVVHINRCAKVVKGGRRFSFSALVVVGDGNGKVAYGHGKAKEVPEAIRKATERAKANLQSTEQIALKGTTIPHEVFGKFDGGRVLLRPASVGTGVIAGGAVRPVLEALGIRDILSKSLGSSNPCAVVKAVIEALRQLRSADEIRQMKQSA